MRVKCHGCENVWELDEAQRTGRCTGCQILVQLPDHKTLISIPVTTEPPDHDVLGIRPEQVRNDLRQFWASFLTRVPPDEYPAAFAQGRAAYERLSAGLDEPARAPLWIVDDSCFFCSVAGVYGFPRCIVCDRDTRKGDHAARPELQPASPKVGSALREIEARWKTGKVRELLAAAERGLAEAAIEEPVRARIRLLEGHALMASNRRDDARSRWTSVMRDVGEGAEASLCLAALAWARGEAVEARHFLDLHEEMPHGRVMKIAALHATRDFPSALALTRDAVASCDGDSRRLRWIAAACEYESGNPRGSESELVTILTNGQRATRLAEIDPAAADGLDASLVWLIAATLSTTGSSEKAAVWFEQGSRMAPTDPSFPREMANLAMQRGNLDDARVLLDETRRRGDQKAAARGQAILEFFQSGGSNAATLVGAATSLRDGSLHYFAGLVLEQNGDASAAIRSYAAAVQTEPLMTRAWAAAGILYARLGAKDRAEVALRQAYDRGERSSPLLRALATLWLEAGRFEDAEPILTELHHREPDDKAIKDNLAGLQCLIGLKEANQGNEEEAIDHLSQALELAPELRSRWLPVLAEIEFRAATRAAHRRAVGWAETANELLGQAIEHAPGAPTPLLMKSAFRLAETLSLSGDERVSSAAAIAADLNAARSSITGGGLRIRADLHQAIALTIANDVARADPILQSCLKMDLDAATRLRFRWVQALSIAKRGNAIAGRVLLEGSLEECAKAPELTEFLKRVRLQALKLKAAELGSKRIESEIRAMEDEARTPAMMLLYGMVLAEQRRFDEASKALETAARDRTLRAEAESTRYIMQMSRVAELLENQKEDEALKLFSRLRPTLPNETEIDLWLNSLEIEGMPVAALRRGDGKPAVATWSSRVGGWRKTKDKEYWELVRSIAVAAHRTAVIAEKKQDYATAETYWRTATTRWLELLDSEDFWTEYARRGRDLFPNFNQGILEEIKAELVDLHLVGLVREVIGRMHSAGDVIAAADRFAVIEQVATWRLDKDPENHELRKAVAGCHAQRLILFAGQQMWEEARRWGEHACEVDPSDPVHFTNMAEMYGGEANLAMIKLEADYAAYGPGPHLQPLARRVIDLLSLALAWNPSHATMGESYTNLSTQMGYAGVSQNDPRIRRAIELRAGISAEALARFSAGQGGEMGETSEHAAGPEVPNVDHAAVSEFARILREAGIDSETAYNTIVITWPVVGSWPKVQAMSLITP